jgi:2-keto-4-pentenoate hydratase/2-oxohepta-3-ene-1,7-dioic acid hydratase in catechol pathway
VFSDFVTFEGNISELRLELHINDQLVQQGGYELMINKPDKIIREAASFLTLEDGDVIMTGTPAGVGPINPGDRFVGKIFENETLVVEGRWTVN